MAVINADLSVSGGDVDFMIRQLQGLTTRQVRRKVSEWAEEARYLPPELTNIPGRWKNSVTPYLVEIMDCLSASHPARKVAVCKGGQIGASTGLLENFIGYSIAEDPSSIIYVSADAGLTKQGVELKVDRMLHHSRLKHLLGPPDGGSKRSGDTAQMKEFPGGFLLAVGAQNPGKLRQTSAKKAVLDELDGMPSILGGIGKEEGDPITIIEKRTDSYQNSRKILYISTPLKLQTSLIWPLYQQGDQRHHLIPCIHCGEFQPLEWHGVTEDRKRYGIVFDLDDNGVLVEESVGYCCRVCQAIFYNHDKAWFLPKGRWEAQAESQEVGLVSFHLPAFYSPPGMYKWTGVVYKWLKAWNVQKDCLRDIEKYQAFRNLEQGLPFEERGETPSAERVRSHRRAIYTEGQIPNTHIIEETGAPALLLTCAVDVHKDRLDVEVLAWCQDRQSYSVEWLHFKGETNGRPGETDCPPGEGCWAELSELIEQREWIADDGRVYRITGTLIDVGWAERADAVYGFCQQYSGGVYPVMGREMPMKGSLIKEFAQSESQLGLVLFNVTASMYKDRLASWLKNDWHDGQLQPMGYPNYPVDRGDDFFKEYEAEEKVQIRDRVTKRVRGWRWQQIGQRPNHAWDCRVYNMAAFDMIVLDFCIDALKRETLSYPDFFKHATPQQNLAGHWLPSPFSYHPDEVAV